jgi:SAM-dependent methyltransferase
MPKVAAPTVSHLPAGPRPSAWLARWMASIGPQARVLDFACGGGRNMTDVLARGASVLGIDRDPAALAALPVGAQGLQADLEGQPWPDALAPRGQFDVILVANYLYRPRLDLLPGCLAPGGLFLYETFGAGNARYGRPSNPAFLLQPGELHAWALRHGLAVLAGEHGFVRRGGGAIVQRLAAVRPPVDFERFPLDADGECD